MARHLIVATDSPPARPLYFLGYRDDGARSECVWTANPWEARWLDADEARVEAGLIAALCPRYVVAARPVSEAGTPRGW